MSRAAITNQSFFYLANKSAGGKAMGLKTARSKRALAEALRKEKKVLVRTWKLPSWMTSNPELNLKAHARLNAQLAQLLSRGVPLTEALEVAATVVPPSNEGRILRMRELVSSGKSFADSCHAVGSFDPVTISVYRAAEKTGDLAGACEQLAKSALRQLEVAGKAATLMIYPAIVLTIAFAASIIMLTLVIPTIGSSLGESGITLPLFTKILMAVGEFIRAYIVLLAVGLLAIIIGMVLFRSGVVKLALSLTRNMIFIRDVVMHQELTRFFAVMGSMTKSGIPLTDALAVSSEVIGHPKLNKDLSKMRTKLVEGGLFRTLIERVESLPLATRRLLIAADQSGDLESAFDALAKDHANETDKRTERLMAVLEPLLIVLLFVIVGTMILGIMLPLMSLTNSVM
ncbi:MAG: type II secretion system F family protein [Phycisphaerales bacterium]|nr:type II secretion system F family protein [Phycisphaerales bacterium]